MVAIETRRTRRTWMWAALAGVAAAVSLAVVKLPPESLKPVIAARFPKVQWVDTETLAEWMQAEPSDAPLLLDVRAADEFAVSHLLRAQRVDPNHPAIASLELATDRKVVVYCSVGYRSGAIAEQLSAAGYEKVYNLEGGIFAWANEGRPVFRGDVRAAVVHPYDAVWGVLLRKDLRAFD
jgi:rhodanese-related sulfurtransferase